MLYDDIYYQVRDMQERREMELPGGCRRQSPWNEQQMSPLARMRYETERTSPYLRDQVRLEDTLRQTIVPEIKIEPIIPVRTYYPVIERTDPVPLVVESSPLLGSRRRNADALLDLSTSKGHWNPVTMRWEKY